MTKKILVFILIFIPLTIGVFDYLSAVRISGIVDNIISVDNMQFIKLIDYETTFGGPVSSEAYAYKIIDKKIDCAIFDKNSTTNHVLLFDFEKKYIDSNKNYCCNLFGDELDGTMHRTIYVTIQNDLMIVTVFEN